MSTGIVLIGALGRMGREIATIVLADPAYELVGAVEYAEHPHMGDDYGTFMGKGPIGVPLSSTLPAELPGNTVIIDFSSPQSLQTYLPDAAARKIPTVICTTGLKPEDKTFINSFSDRTALLVSPNTSLGVNLLFLLTEMVSKRLKDDYDIEIIEAHHRFKKDAPSGTAKRLGEIVADSIGLPYDECIKDGREGIFSADRSSKEVGMHAVRGGDIVGDHTVLFAGIGERIELRHMAHSRSTFAKGAVLVAQWIVRKDAGLYTMRDMLEL